jgi:hypothetical protein
MRAAQEGRVQHGGQFHVRNKKTSSIQEARVLVSHDARTDSTLGAVLANWMHPWFA